MKCANISCIYNGGTECHAEEIKIGFLGVCSACVICTNTNYEKYVAEHERRQREKENETRMKQQYNGHWDSLEPE